MSLTLDMGTVPKGTSVSIWPQYLLNHPKKQPVKRLKQEPIVCIDGIEMTIMDFFATMAYVKSILMVQKEWEKYLKTFEDAAAGKPFARPRTRRK